MFNRHYVWVIHIYCWYQTRDSNLVFLEFIVTKDLLPNQPHKISYFHEPLYIRQPSSSFPFCCFWWICLANKFTTHTSIGWIDSKYIYHSSLETASEIEVKMSWINQNNFPMNGQTRVSSLDHESDFFA